MTFWKTERGALLLLLGVSALLLLLGLGSRDLWGPETRWANIALQMLQSGDYFDPIWSNGSKKRTTFSRNTNARPLSP